MEIFTRNNTRGIFSSDAIWFPTYYVLNNLWNYSDSSLEFAQVRHTGTRVPRT